MRYGKLLSLPENFLFPLVKTTIEIYGQAYPGVKKCEQNILQIIKQEEEKFEKMLESGLKQLDKIISQGVVTGAKASTVYQTYGFPLELIEEIVTERGGKIEDREQFFVSFKKHQEISRAGSGKKFGGGGEFSPKLHTATHLLHAALRQVLGEHVQQMGSDITAERLRFDFSHPQKMTPQEIKQVEDLVNQKIKEDLPVEKKEMTYQEAVAKGALAFFKEKYPDKVSVYSVIGFSKEICAGPHAERTSQLGNFKIIKEESSSAGVRRIKAVLQ
jgi:alanyl-tRNA synthetase